MKLRCGCSDLLNMFWLRFACSRKHGVGKLVVSSSPSTRFDGSDIDGLKEDDLTIPKKFLQVCMRVPRGICGRKSLLPGPLHGPYSCRHTIEYDAMQAWVLPDEFRSVSEAPTSACLPKTLATIVACASYMQRAKQRERRPFWKPARIAFSPSRLRRIRCTDRGGCSVG